MFAGYGNDPMPSDKLMKLFIIQSISAFVANDYDTGVHFLSEIKQTYAEHMGKLNPTLKQLAKEIIQAVDMFNPDASGGMFAEMGNSPAQSSQPSMPASSETQETSVQQSQQPQQPQEPQSNQQQPSSVASELQELLKRRKEKRRK